MKRVVLVALVAVGCGPPCPDARCSLTSTPTHVERVDYTHHEGSSTAPGVTPTSGSGSAVVPGSAVAVGPGSAVPPKPPVVNAPAEWAIFENPTDKSRIFIVTKSDVAPGSTVKLEFIKVPEAPFALYLEVKHPGAAAETKIWNDCPPEKLRCDVQGMKSYVVKATGAVSLAARTNWSVTDLVDQGPTYQVTWKNNLSADVLTIRLYK